MIMNHNINFFLNRSEIWDWKWFFACCYLQVSEWQINYNNLCDILRRVELLLTVAYVSMCVCLWFQIPLPDDTCELYCHNYSMITFHMYLSYHMFYFSQILVFLLPTKLHFSIKNMFCVQQRHQTNDQVVLIHFIHFLVHNLKAVVATCTLSFLLCGKSHSHWRDKNRN